MPLLSGLKLLIIEIPVKNVTSQTNRKPCCIFLEGTYCFKRRIKIPVDDTCKKFQVRRRIYEVTRLDIRDENSRFITLANSYSSIKRPFNIIILENISAIIQCIISSIKVESSHTPRYFSIPKNPSSVVSRNGDHFLKISTPL